MPEFVKTVIEEALKGNFSFPILVVGLMQICLMVILHFDMRKRKHRLDDVNM